MKKSFVLILVIISVKLFSFGQQGWMNYDNLNIVHPICITFDKLGNKWIGTLDSGVYKFDGKSLINYNQLNSSISTYAVQSISVDSTGTIWFPGFPITSYNGSKWLTFDKFSDEYGNWHYSFYTDFSRVTHNGTVLQSDGGQILRFNGVDFETRLVDCNISPNKYITFTNQLNFQVDEDKNDLFWQAYSYSDGYGLINFKCPPDTIRLNLVNDYKKNRVTLKIDKQNNKWVGTRLNGLFKFDGINWVNYNTKNSGLVDDTIRSLAFDSKDNLWVGTQHGLSKFDGINWTSYTTANSGLKSNIIRVIEIDKSDVKWILSGDNYPSHITSFDDMLSTTSIDNRFINSFTVYPNPTNANIHITNLTKGNSISISDINGRVIYNTSIISESLNIPLSEVASKGFYFLNVLENAQILETRKIVLE